MKRGCVKISPGELIREEIYPAAGDELRLALDNEFALVMDESKPIDEAGAIRLSELFGTSVDLWLNLQAAYDGVKE